MRFAALDTMPQEAMGLIAAGGPPSWDLREFYLPGGQSYKGVPNIDNPDLQRRLKERKAPGMLGPGPALPPI